MPVTAPVSLSKIKTEFNGPNSFQAYVRGGTYVPSTRVLAGSPFEEAINSAVSTTVAGLAISQFLNATSYAGGYETYNPGFSGVTTAPVGATFATIELVGAGGGNTNSGGGAGGGYIRKTIAVVGGVTQITIDYIGSPGSLIPSGPQGSSGGDTSVTVNGVTYIGYGGEGGRNNWSNPAQGGTTSGNGDINSNGYPQNQNFGGPGGGYDYGFFPRDTPNNPLYSLGASRGEGVFASWTGECPYNCGCVVVTWY